MGQVILVTSGKGGAGKSTFAVNCGAALASAGKSVLLVDTDAGLRALDLMLGVSDKVVYDLKNVLAGECETFKAILSTNVANLFLLPAPQSVSCEYLDSAVLKRLCSGLAGYYDFVMVDSPAGVGSGARIAAACCDSAVVVATADPVCVRDADRIASVLIETGIRHIRLVINRVNARLVRRKAFPDLDAVIDGAAIQLIGVVPEDEAVTMAAFSGRALAGGRSQAARAYANIAARLCGREVPLLKL